MMGFVLVFAALRIERRVFKVYYIQSTFLKFYFKADKTEQNKRE